MTGYFGVPGTRLSHLDDGFKVGHQNDGSGHYYSVICNTPHGKIPGKGKENRAWYSYGGKEHEVKSSSFEYLLSHAGYKVHLEKSNGPPAGAVTGHQNNTGTMYAVVCHHTSHGKIPGKSNGRTSWYSWGGKEHETKDFSYVVVKSGFNPFPGPPVLPHPVHPAHFPHPHPHPHQGGAGYAPTGPPPQGLAEGMTVRFRCKTGRNLKLGGDGVVSGHGANGKFATFRVHVVGAGRYAFQNQNGQWLAIKRGICTASPRINDPDAGFLLHLNIDQSVSFESQTYHGCYLAVKRKSGVSKLGRAGNPSTKFHVQVV